MNLLKKTASVFCVLMVIGMAAYYISPYRVLLFHPDGIRLTRMKSSGTYYTPVSVHYGYTYEDIGNGALVGAEYHGLFSGFVYVVSDIKSCPAGEDKSRVIRKGVLCEARGGGGFHDLAVQIVRESE